MKNVIKKCISIAIAFMMVCGIWIHPTFAEETTGETTSTPETTQVQEEPTPTPDMTSTPEASEQATATVESWHFEGDTFIDNNGTWEVNPTASVENPLTKDALLQELPTNVILVMNGQEVTKPITWNLDTYDESQYEGEYTIYATIVDTTDLPQDFSNQLEAKVVFDSPAEVSLDDYLVDGVTPKGTTIDLFDYWLGDSESDRLNPDRSNTGYNERVDAGINKNHELKFDGFNSYRASANNYSSNQQLKQGILQKNLGEDGYPALTTDGTYGISSGESLAYLFNPNYEHVGKKSYSNVGNLLQVDKDGYFYYDCKENYAAFDETTNNFKLYQKGGVTAIGTASVTGSGQQVGQFFPFNSGETVFRETNGTLVNKDLNSQYTNGSESINHYFGVHMNTRFVQQYGGYTSEDINNRNAVTYEFSGDDDVWVFIDGVLVADLGGIHAKQSLKINFVTGAVEIPSGKSTTLKEVFNLTGNTFQDGTYHTLDFYYFERGNSDSNMELKFNLLEIPESDLIKVDQLGNPVAGAEFNLYATGTGDDFNVGENQIPIATGITDETGSFVLVDKNDSNKLISLEKLYDNGNQTNFVLREEVTPQGYRSNGDIQLYLVKNASTNGVIMLAKDYWNTGVYASAKLSVTLPNIVYSVNDVNDPGKTIDGETGNVFAVILKYTGNGDPTNDVSGWEPLYGSLEDGWQIMKKEKDEESQLQTVINAAKEQSNYDGGTYIFTPSSSGTFSLLIDNLPGDILTYYNLLSDDAKDQTKYTIGYYYTTGDFDSNSVTTENTYRLDSDDANGLNREQFGRVFATNLLVPNIRNYILAQKFDDDGNTLTGAEFTLYKQDNNGTKTINVNGSEIKVTPKETNTTKNLVHGSDGNNDTVDSFINLSGGAIFPSDEKVTLESGVYYLVETKAPAGYKINEKPVKIIINNTGVYADAGSANDGIRVARGVGSLLKTMSRFAQNDSIDATLHEIYTTLSTTTNESDIVDGNIATPLSWGTTKVDDNNVPEELHLKYQSNAALEYGPIDENGNRGFITDVGYSRLNIYQCLNPLHGDLHNKTNLGNSSNQDVTSLFSNSVTIMVTDEKVNTLSLEKTVTGKGSDSINDEFEFSLKLTLNNVLYDEPISYEKFDASGSEQKGTVKSTNGVYTIHLKNNEKINFLSLKTGLKYEITETEKQGFQSSILVNNTPNENASGEITDEGTQKVQFINDIVKSLEFKKVDESNNPLSGAKFALYKFICSENHTDHSSELNELIDVNADGTIKDAYKDKWELVSIVDSSSEETLKGVVQFNNLTTMIEQYRLVELKAPNGYVLPKGQWTIIYNSESQKFEFGTSVGMKDTPAVSTDKGYQIKNYKPQDLPLTGFNGITFYLVGGMILMLIGGGSLFLSYKRRVM